MEKDQSNQPEETPALRETVVVRSASFTVNEHAWLNNTWLAPYFGYPARLIEYASGKVDLELDGELYEQVEGSYTSEYNDWIYSIKKLLSPVA